MRVSGQTADGSVASAHERLAREGGFQFEHAVFTPPKVPGWLAWVGEVLKAAAPMLKVVFWIGLAALTLLIIFAIVREIIRAKAPPARAEGPKLAADPAWRPDAAAARDLLLAADQLAADGRFLEAAHLLLLRSVEDIQKHRPKALRVSYTAREIALLPALPEAARPAFAGIAGVVERGLFGGRPVDAEDFAACRAAYEAFALPEGWAR
ncbi:DUF4129 domain-containing protein [Caulobacter vibrioides]|uniref:Protein-glutamine gamma-glutamyltransferase-like C-terminal domain-containing protein n=1 Tax=Caulobacter vibrioides (strain NA1000 / CB15N) TaxID=565050 RepID=A0A0H3IA71_CAUVN|nr:DUF4129 domain-containing protein [Caulobacter vibrioides]YP_008877602.1 hypothetical protein CCNA_03887 [Caulobacter vibrioides NA1000]AGJ94601.1 hypothetical protein CCNA_03887 [Caulobacter vibrioides NA1000]ATC27409.1 hypothetical protein CA607_03020 [Caulobacter vibrioides]QXZ52646.1 hypothetical protein KZH45_02920 [Caulobacter vibrioides]